MYMGKPTGPSAGMVFCQNEKNKRDEGNLKGDCFVGISGYRCIVQFKGKRHSFGSHETVTLCNAVHDKELLRLNKGFVPTKKARKPLAKGYREQKLADGTATFYPGIILNKKMVSLGTTKCADKAQAIYLKRFEKEFGPIEK